MFCFGDYQRPNCLGKRLAADHLLQYTEQFMLATGPRGDESRQPWAAFVHFIDSHEDTLTMAGTIDQPLHDFIQALHARHARRHARTDLDSSPLAPSSDEPIVVLLSDHGLHYGPYFNTPAGNREQAQPVLYMHVPTAQAQPKLHKANLDALVTPYDVHRTVLDACGLTRRREGVTEGDTSTEGTEGYGRSLFEPIVNEGSRRKCADAGVPQEYCLWEDGRDDRDASPQDGKDAQRAASRAASRAGKRNITAADPNDMATTCKPLPHPPSVLSFYSDIPATNKPVFPECTKKSPPVSVLVNRKVVLKSSNVGGRVCTVSTLYAWLRIPLLV
jgi:hypothetical protein